MHAVVLIWIDKSRRSALHAYERKVAPIMSRHGGRFTSALEIQDISDASFLRDGAPDEVHVLEFPDQASFDAWRADPDMLALAEEREALAARVLMLSGDRALTFHRRD